MKLPNPVLGLRTRTIFKKVLSSLICLLLFAVMLGCSQEQKPGEQIQQSKNDNIFKQSSVIPTREVTPKAITQTEEVTLTQETPNDPYKFLSGTVTRVIDGDTAVIALSHGKAEKVRFIGVNTPESTTNILYVSLVVTVLAYLIGDLLILDKTNNTVATISDAGLALLAIWAFNWILPDARISFTDALIAAVVVGIGEWFFHKYVSRAVFPPVERT